MSGDRVGERQPEVVLVSRTGRLEPEAQAIFDDLVSRPGFVDARQAPRAIVNDEMTIRIVVERSGVRLERGTQVWRSHPGMGMVRLRRVNRGEPDPMLTIANVREGERVLDCTFGYGHDALLFARAVGEEGEVVGLEANPALAALAHWGMRFWPVPARDVARRISVEHADHREWLRAQPDESFDIVYFDPMFRQGITAAPGFELLRWLGVPDPLSHDTLEEAKRVARRLVLVKDAAHGQELERLNLSIDTGRRGSKLWFGYWHRNGAG